jgi:hypothetical protein
MVLRWPRLRYSLFNSRLPTHRQTRTTVWSRTVSLPHGLKLCQGLFVSQTQEAHTGLGCARLLLIFTKADHVATIHHRFHHQAEAL